ncbi:MHS family MFS transporter, partial [Arthrobacter deserti]|nr:MHS family MFS transporter [Arthrobacter deserti]
LFTQPFFGNLADRIGRKPVFIYGAVSSAVFMPLYLLSMESGNTLLQFALSVVVFSCGYAAANAVWPSFYSVMFSARVRFSGLAIGTQLGFLMAGFAPSIVAAIGGLQPGGWVATSIFTAAICAVASVSALTARETCKVPTAELGLREPAKV